MAVFRNWIFPTGFPAKIIAINKSDFKNKAYWAIEGVPIYSDVFYCYVSESRPLFEIEREVVKNNLGENNVIFQSKVQKYRFDFIVNSAFIDMWSTLTMYDEVRLVHLRANQTVFLKNLEFTDNTQGLDQGTISITGELSIVLDRKCQDSDVIEIEC